MSYTSELALALLLIIPLAAAAIIPLVGTKPNVREGVTFVAGVLLLLNVIGLISMVAAGDRPELHLFTFAGNFDVRLKLEPLGAIFAAIAAAVATFFKVLCGKDPKTIFYNIINAFPKRRRH